MLLTTSDGRIKLLHDVQYVPGLAHNLLSVGQLVNSGYSVIFTRNECVIYNAKT